MQFLKTLFWVVVAVFLAILGTRNWHDVTLRLWGDILVDIKLPVLVLLVFLLGLVPTWLVLRARMWALKRRLEPFERQRAAAAPPLAEPTRTTEPEQHPAA